MDHPVGVPARRGGPPSDGDRRDGKRRRNSGWGFPSDERRRARRGRRTHDRPDGRRSTISDAGDTDDDSPARFISGDCVTIQICDGVEFGGCGPVGVLQDIDGIGDLLLLMVRHDLELELRGPFRHGGEFDEVGD